MSEPFAYPLFVAAVAAGTVALARPTPRAQAAFLGLALLATFARMQLAVLPLAYLAAALMLRRARAQRFVVGGLTLAVVIALAGGLGYYRKAPGAFHLVSPAALGRNALVLAYGLGWILVPAAILGLVAAFARARSEEERAFGALALTAGVAVLAPRRLSTATLVSRTSATAAICCRCWRLASRCTPAAAGRGGACTRCSPAC